VSLSRQPRSQPQSQVIDHCWRSVHNSVAIWRFSNHVQPRSRSLPIAMSPGFECGSSTGDDSRHRETCPDPSAGR
jgi:hypothetical protein